METLNKILFIVFAFLLVTGVSVLVSGIQFTPQGNINLSGRYVIVGWNLSLGIFNVTSNDSAHWDGLDSPLNITSMKNVVFSQNVTAAYFKGDGSLLDNLDVLDTNTQHDSDGRFLTNNTTTKSFNEALLNTTISGLLIPDTNTQHNTDGRFLTNNTTTKSFNEALLNSTISGLLIPDTNTQHDSDGRFLSNNTTTKSFNEVLLNTTISGLLIPDTNTQHDTDGVFLSNNSTTKSFNEALLNSTISGLLIPDTNTQHDTDGHFLYNNTTTKSFNESLLNDTISGLVIPDTNTQHGTDGRFLSNNTTTKSFNESLLNDTILGLVIPDTNTQHGTDGRFLSNNTTTKSFDEALLNSTISGLVIPDTRQDSDGVFLYNDSSTMFFNDSLLNTTVAGLNASRADFWDDLDTSSDIVSLGNVSSGTWSADSIVDAFLSSLDASKLFNLAALNGNILVFVANISDAINLVNSHLHDSSNITNEPWLEDGSLSDLSDSNISSLALTKITGADVNCPQGYVTNFNASNGTISCAVDASFNYTMDISDAITKAAAPSSTNVFATIRDLTLGNVTVTNIQNIRNQEGVTMPRGAAVRFTNYSTGNARPNVRFASNNDTALKADCLILNSVNAGGNGRCVVTGTLSNVDTTLWSEGVDLYLNSTRGTLTAIKPRNATCIQRVGQVLRSNSTSGIIWVNGGLGCNDAPSTINISGNVTATHFFGNGSQLTGIVKTTDTNASTACSGNSTYLSGEGSCNDVADQFVSVLGDSMVGSLNMTGNNITDVANITFLRDPSNHVIFDNSSCIIIKAGSTTLNICE